MMDSKILNLTQHSSIPSQKQAGIIDPPAEVKERVKSLLTFNSPPSQEEMVERAKQLALIVKDLGYSKVLIGGAPFFMSTLELVLSYYNIKYCYSFSKRRSKEVTLPDGSVKKVSVFEHAGLVDTNRVMSGWYENMGYVHHIFDNILRGEEE